MFCSKCGKQIADESKFCPNCGQNIAGGVAQHHSMSNAIPAYETKVEKVYDLISDIMVNEREDPVQNSIVQNEVFYWKVLSTQVVDNDKGELIREGNKTYYDSKRYTNITFQRDTSLPWYSEVVELENEFKQLKHDTLFTPEQQCSVSERSLLYHGGLLEAYGPLGCFLEFMYWGYFPITIPITIIINQNARNKEIKFKEENYDRIKSEFDAKLRRMAEIQKLARHLPSKY